ncbi:unnamed protein product [Miscanthus lutarioriparius]|uniref:Uncharacterized protein n=1 Tax=Miscanthus lutarioriparius TaxID=422564 RepID=A0A811RJF8_9POAL|nr:unnamed protein product [Miscanthus lutarioriparius]
MSSPTAPWFADLFTDDRVRTLSHQVSTLGDRVWEPEHKITQLEKQLEETKAISSHKEEVERSFKAENDKLRSEVLVAEEKCSKSENDKLQSEVLVAEEKCSKSEAEVEMLMKELGALAEAKEAADYEFNYEIIILELEDRKRRLEEIQAIKDLAESENDKHQSEALITEEKQNMSEAEIERLKMELSGLVEAKEVAAKAFDAKNAEITKELEDLKRKLKEIQTNKDFLEGENDKVRSEVFVAEEKCRQSEAEVKCLKQVVGALVEAKEAAAKTSEAEKVEVMKEMDNLKRKIEEIQANKDSVESQNQELRSKILTAEQEHSPFEAEVKSLKMELGSRGGQGGERRWTWSTLAESEEIAVKSFDTEKAKLMKEVESLKRKIEEIHASKEAAEEAGRNKDAEADRLMDELVKIRVSVSQLQASFNEGLNNLARSLMG